MARLTREAQVLASLNHPNIAAIYGVQAGALVMELVEGDTLAGPIPPEQALPIIQQLVDALPFSCTSCWSGLRRSGGAYRPERRNEQ